MKRENKKGQMEMIGLVIIVILISLGMLLLVRFGLNSNQDKKTFVNEGLVSSTLSSIAKTSAVCQDQNDGTIKRLEIQTILIEDCANYYQTNEDGIGLSVFQCDGKHSCGFTKDLIKNLLNQTLRKYGKNYQLTATLIINEQTNEEIFKVTSTITAGGEEIESGGCPEEREAAEFITPSNGGIISTVLHICD